MASALLSNRGKYYLLTIVCLVAFFPVFSADYLKFDEQFSILNNPVLKMPLNLESLLQIFCSFTENQYTPLSTLTFWLEYNLFGFISFISHLINLLIHIFGVFAFYHVTYYLLKKETDALLLSLIWAIHPMQVESVAWVIGRRTLLYGSFFFASIAFYLKYLDTNKKADKYLAIIMMALSSLSKTLAFSAPAIWLAIDWIKGRKITFNLLKEKTLSIILAVVLILIMLIAAKSGVINNDKQDLYWRQAAFAIGDYPLLTAYPHNLSGLNELNSYSLEIIQPGFIYLSIYIAISVYLACYRKLALFGFLFYLFHIFPMSGLIRVGYPFYISYHFCYVAQLGIILQFYEGVKLIKQKFLNSVNFRKISYSVAIIIILVFTVQTFQFSIVWQNSEYFALNALKIDQYNRFARGILCHHYKTNNDFDKLAYHSQKQIRLHENYYRGYADLCEAYIHKQDFKQALLLINKAIELKGTFSTELTNTRAYCYYRLEEWEKAENDYTKVLEVLEAHLMARTFRAICRDIQGKRYLANEDYKILNKLQPYNIEIKIKWLINRLKSLDIVSSLQIGISIFSLILQELQTN